MTDIKLHRDGAAVIREDGTVAGYFYRGVLGSYEAAQLKLREAQALVALLDAERAEDARKANEEKVEALAQKMGHEDNWDCTGSRYSRLARIAIDHLEGASE